MRTTLKHMNVIIYSLFILVMTAITFTGCKKDSSGDVKSDNLVGKWYYVKSEEKSPYGTDNETYTDGEYVQFNADGTMYDGLDNQSGTWSLSGNNLTVAHGKESYTFQITKLTKNEMVWQINYSDSEYTAYFKK